MNVIGDFDKANARVREIRSCNQCQQEQDIDQFPEYVQGGRIYRRGTCRECMQARTREWKRTQSQRMYRERMTMLRSVVGRLSGQGMSGREIARTAGVSTMTICRLMNNTEGRTRFEKQTEERILDAYLEAVA